MINKINGPTANVAGSQQNQTPQRPTAKAKLHNFKDNFVKSSKTMLPGSVLFAGAWALFDSRKNMKLLGPKLINNIVDFVVMGLIVSGIDSLFKMNTAQKK